MDNLNNIPNVGNWGDAASKLNDNFNKIKQAVTTVENTSKNNKGYFASLSALNTAFPSPKAGQTAYVYGEASSTNYYTYNAVNGAWVASSVEAPSVGVDLAGYTKTGGSTKTTKDIDVIKANHGYESNPKTLKEVDDEKADHGYASIEVAKTLKQVEDNAKNKFELLENYSYDEIQVILTENVGYSIDIDGEIKYLRPSTLSSAIIPLMEGDRLVITGKGGGSAYRGYTFLDKDFNILEQSGVRETFDSKKVVPPKNSVIAIIQLYAEYEPNVIKLVNKPSKSYITSNTNKDMLWGEVIFDVGYAYSLTHTDGSFLSQISKKVLVEKTQTDNYSSKIIQVNGGDEFLLTGYSYGNAYALMCVLDKNDNLIDFIAAKEYINNFKATLPLNADRVIINVRNDETHSLHAQGERIEEIERNIRELGTSQTDVDFLRGDISLDENFAYSVREIEQNPLAVGSTVIVERKYNEKFDSKLLTVKSGDKIIINGRGGGSEYRGFYILDESDKVLKVSGVRENFTEREVIVPDGGVKFICQFYNEFEYSVNVKDGRITNLESKEELPPLVYFEKDSSVSDFTNDIIGINFKQKSFLNDIQGKFDELAAEFPEFVEKTDIADLVDVVYPEYANGILEGHPTYLETPAYRTYLYKFSTNEAGISEGENSKKKILIIPGVHGPEQTASVVTYLYMNRLCREFTECNNLFSVRSAFEIYVIPAINGYGAIHNTRRNANNIDINRNFPVKGWTSNESTYTGDVAGSEFEVDTVMKMIDLLNPSFVIDFHNFSGLEGQSFVTIFSWKHSRAIYRAYSNSNFALLKNYPEYFGDKYRFFTDKKITPNNKWDSNTGTLARMAAQKNVDFSMTFEVSDTIHFNEGVWVGGANPSKLHHPDVFSIGEHFFREVIMQSGLELWKTENFSIK